MTHALRKHVNFQNVSFQPSTVCNINKEEFLSNCNNKQKIIFLIGIHLTRHGCRVVHSKGDADVDIAKTAVVASSSSTVTVIGEDTDILVLLIYWCCVSKHALFMRSDIKRTVSTKSNVVYDICAMRKSLHADVVKCLLTLHAFTGCDTTSRIFSVGKQTAFKRLLSDEQLRSDALLFSSSNLSPNDVEVIGCRVMVQLFGGKVSDTLNTFRNRQFIGKSQICKALHLTRAPSADRICHEIP